MWSAQIMLTKVKYAIVWIGLIYRVPDEIVPKYKELQSILNVTKRFQKVPGPTEMEKLSRSKAVFRYK